MEQLRQEVASSSVRSIEPRKRFEILPMSAEPTTTPNETLAFPDTLLSSDGTARRTASLNNIQLGS